MSTRTNRWVIAAAIAALILGAILSRVIEPGVRVEKVTLVENTPALKFIPAGPGSHPVAKYLPESVKVPARDGKQIRLLNLAIHTAGLPRDSSNLTPGHGLPENPFADYNVEKLYAFLSSFALDREPGSEFEYSNVGMALLGHTHQTVG